MVKISPSILNADLANLEREVKALEAAGADMLHIDVMDGVFVPNISIGLPVIKSLRKCTNMFFDVHLMIVNPEKYVERFIECGADLVSIHYESTTDAGKVLDTIRSHGKKAGLAISPKTDPKEIFALLPKCDLVTVMTVEPGFGGQKLIESCAEKIAVLKAEILKENLKVEVEVDGGINAKNAPHLRNLGADILVAGSYITSSNDKKIAIDSLR